MEKLLFVVTMGVALIGKYTGAQNMHLSRASELRRVTNNEDLLKVASVCTRNIFWREKRTTHESLQ